MALRKDIEVGNSGVNAQHHVVSSVRIDIEKERAVISTDGYLNAGARNTGKNPISEAAQSFVSRDQEYQDLIADAGPGPGPSSGFIDDLKSRAYTVIKGRPEFAGATDV